MKIILVDGSPWDVAIWEKEVLTEAREGDSGIRTCEGGVFEGRGVIQYLLG